MGKRAFWMASFLNVWLKACREMKLCIICIGVHVLEVSLGYFEQLASVYCKQ